MSLKKESNPQVLDDIQRLVSFYLCCYEAGNQMILSWFSSRSFNQSLINSKKDQQKLEHLPTVFRLRGRNSIIMSILNFKCSSKECKSSEQVTYGGNRLLSTITSANISGRSYECMLLHTKRCHSALSEKRKMSEKELLQIGLIYLGLKT